LIRFRQDPSKFSAFAVCKNHGQGTKRSHWFRKEKPAATRSRAGSAFHWGFLARRKGAKVGGCREGKFLLSYLHDLMFRTVLTRAGCMIGLLIIFFAPGLAQAQVVKEVRVAGLRALEENTVRAYIELKPGDEFSLDTVDSDIKRLYGSGLVEDVKVEENAVPEEPGYVIITYVIIEKWMVREVRFEGNRKVSAEDIKNLVSIPAHSIFNPEKLAESVEKIRKEYAAKGMFLTRVGPRVEEVKEGVVDIVFEVEEHPKPPVARVGIYGSRKLRTGQIRKIMVTKQQWYLAGSSKFDQDLLDEDLFRVYTFYLDNGFLESKVQNPQAYLDPDQERVYVSMFIQEGDQYKVAQVRVQGDLVASEEDLRKGLSLIEGEIYSESVVRRDLQYLSDTYSNLGYHLAQIDRDLRLEKSLRLVYITYNIRKGPRIYLERINVKGNLRTLDPVIRRELAIREGYLYSDADVRRSKSRLMRLGYFEQVDSFDRPGSELDRMVLDFGLKEAKSGTLMAGAGYSSLEQFFLSLQYQQRNFLGRGYNLNTTLRSSSFATDFFCDFEDPYLLQSDYHLGINAYSYRTRYYYFDESRTGAAVTIGRKLPHTEYSYGFLAYSWDLADLEHFSEASRIYERVPNNAPTSSLTLSWKRNALNNYMDPTRGSYSVASAEYAGGPLGGENNFTKALAETRYYLPLPGKKIGHYLALRGRIAYLWNPDSEKLLITERFFLGGSNSLRGYEPGSVSPVYVEDTGEETRIGGNKMLLLSADYIIPLGPSGFKLALFYDAGNAYNDNQGIDLDQLRQDWGVGVLWSSPLGPLRFELGFPIEREEGEETQVFNFGMGTVY